MNWLLDAEPQFFEGMAWYRPLRNGRPPLLCLPGYQDTARTFIFLETVLLQFDPVLVDWRGQGASTFRIDGIYTIQETFADLVRITHAIFDRPFHIIGHSMGSALGARFAGLLPDRVLSLALLEGFSGLISPEEEVDRLTRWAKHLTEADDPHRIMHTFDDVCRTLSRIHRGVRSDRIAILARLLSKPIDPLDLSAGYIWVHDPALKHHTVPLSFAPDVSRALWRRITAPGILLMGEGSHLHPNRRLRSREAKPQDARTAAASPLEEITAHFAHLELCRITGAGHNLHHDAPETVVPFLLDFYQRNGFL